METRLLYGSIFLLIILFFFLLLVYVVAKKASLDPSLTLLQKFYKRVLYTDPNCNPKA